MHVTVWRPLCVCLLLLSCVARLSVADEPDAAQAVKTLILPGESFVVEGRPSFVLLPGAEAQRTPQPWIMYASTNHLTEQEARSPLIWLRETISPSVTTRSTWPDASLHSRGDASLRSTSHAARSQRIFRIFEIF